MIFLSKDQVKNTSNISVTSNVVGYPVENVQLDKKSSTWKSDSSNTQTLSITWQNNIDCNFIALAHHNFDSNTVVRLKYYSSAANVTPAYDSGNVSIGMCFDPPNGFATNSGNSFVYGGGNYFCRQTPQHSIQKLELSILNNTPDGVYEVARLLCGDAKSLKYHPDIGVATNYNDESETTRTESGDTLVNILPSHKALNFNYGYLEKDDRQTLINLFRRVGSTYPVFISMNGYREDAIDKSLMIYGRLNDNDLSLNQKYSSSTSIKVSEY
jgi:hypothetical protein